MRPFVSVIVPVRQEVGAIGCCLASILASRYPRERMEVIVADGMSRDGTRAAVALVAKQDARVRLLDNPARTTPHALNRAIAASRGDVLVRVDAHSAIAPDYVAELVGFLESHPDAWGVGGRMLTVAATKGWFAQAARVALSHRFGVGNSGFRTAANKDAAPYQVDTVFNCAWPREVFRRVGDFDELLARSQDIEFSTRILRAGGSLWLAPRAETTYFARTRARAFLAHNWTNGVWSVLPSAYLRRTPVRWRHLIPLAFVSALLASSAAALLLPSLRWVPWAVAGPYLLANLAASLSAAWRERNGALAPLLPVAFAGLHLSYGAGSLWGVMRVAAILLKRRVRAGPPLSESTL